MSMRINRLVQSFRQHDIDGIFVSSEPNVGYLSGFRGMESFLFITKKSRTFLTDFRYVEQARKEAPGFKILLRDSQPYAQMIEALREKERCRRIGFEAMTLPHALYMQLSKAIPGKHLVPTKHLVESLRIRKDAREISYIKEAIRISADGIKNLVAGTRPGMNEKEVQAQMEYHTKLKGSEKPAFDIIIARGAKSSMPHAVSDHASRIHDRDILLVDMGVVYQGYHSDLTRCFFMGKIPPLMRKVYQIVLRAQEQGIRKVRPGVRAADVDLACRNFIHRRGYGKHFGHGTGHGVGLEVHEAPTVSSRSTEILEPGMVITVEPGIYLANQFGVRIEDMVLVTDNGHEVLTSAINKRLRP